MIGIPYTRRNILRFGLDEAAFGEIAGEMVIGFPVALILAWAFELTPEGIKRTDEIEPGLYRRLKDVQVKQLIW
jgi:hypothetical protein